jgi:O-acetyl-ADP-ribose deacetylase (regulator of RNase III)
MVIIKIIEDDILNAKEKYIAHQTNCVMTSEAGGVARAINKKYPWADTYSTREKRLKGLPDKPGTIVKMTHPTEPKKYHRILCFMSQYYPGPPRKPNDTYEMRKKWFQRCLDILDQSTSQPVAMPYGIAAGLSGGKWSDIEEMLNKCQSKIVLYKI